MLSVAKDPYYKFYIQSIAPHIDKLRNLPFGPKLCKKLVSTYPEIGNIINQQRCNYMNMINNMNLNNNKNQMNFSGNNNIIINNNMQIENYNIVQNQYVQKSAEEQKKNNFVEMNR